MTKTVPKIIWILWFQGWEEAPIIVKKCLNTWIEHNPDWTINKLTNDNLSDFIDIEAIIPGYKQKSIPPETLSDIIRIALLNKYGGIWVDSTLYCNIPLNNWLHKVISNSGFFAFANPGPDRMLSNWFLVSYENNTIIQKWYEEAVKYWSTRNKRDNYFWSHYLFADIYNFENEFKRAWDNTPKFSADAPHHFLPYDKTFYEKLTKQEKKIIDTTTIPVFKLTHKYDTDKAFKGSVIHYLVYNPINNNLFEKILNFIRRNK